MPRIQISLLFAMAMAWCAAIPTLACQWCGGGGGTVSYCPFESSCQPNPAPYETGGGGDDPQLAPFSTQNNGWTNTSQGTSGLGRPVQLTWSIVPDGTRLPTGVQEPSSDSDLVEFLDDLFEGGNSPGGTTDLSQRSWFSLVDSSFNRWTELAGIDFQYASNTNGQYAVDDGARVPFSSGIINRRGDHRLSGHYLDGDVRPSVLAYNYFPNQADMVIDTSEVTIFGNPEGNYLRLRNTLMHEIGHGLGLAHNESNDTTQGDDKHVFGSFLMEPILSVQFDGPQFDDILGMHRLYGDVLEKDGGNDTAATATDLGTLDFLQQVVLGSDGHDTFVAATDTDFVSIDDDSDIDYFQFTITQPRTVNVELAPIGPDAYLNGRDGTASAGTQTLFSPREQSNLVLQMLATDGISSLVTENSTSLGEAEQIVEFDLTEPGTYFLRISGIGNAAQMYELSLISVPEPATCLLAAMGLMAGIWHWRRQT